METTIMPECGTTVWEYVGRFCKTNWKRLRKEGKPMTHDELMSAMSAHLREYSGNDSKKWLFIWSPASANRLFEVGGDDLERLVMATTKLVTISSQGGMLVGADFSENWGTPKSKGIIRSLEIAS